MLEIFYELRILKMRGISRIIYEQLWTKGQVFVVLLFY
jgi:hypothetical protein